MMTMNKNSQGLTGIQCHLANTIKNKNESD